jgi:hypothetical protein
MIALLIIHSALYNVLKEKLPDPSIIHTRVPVRVLNWRSGHCLKVLAGV